MFYSNVSKFIKTKLGFNEPTMSRGQFIINGIIVFVLGIFFEEFSWREYTPYIILQLGVLILAGFIYIPSLIKRSHTVGWSQVWWIGLVPFINLVYFFALIIKSSKNMNNNSSKQTGKENTNVQPKPSENENTVEEADFLQKFIKGDFGLAKTFWIFGIGIFFLSGLMWQASQEYSTQITFFYFSHAVYSFFAAVAVGRAAYKYNGFVVWKVLALVYTFIILLLQPLGFLLDLLGL